MATFVCWRSRCTVTRRFCARPSSVLLDATGNRGTVKSRVDRFDIQTRRDEIVGDRFGALFDNMRFFRSRPELSVCPST